MAANFELHPEHVGRIVPGKPRYLGIRMVTRGVTASAEGAACPVFNWLKDGS
jgi:hypothetical protein